MLWLSCDYDGSPEFNSNQNNKILSSSISFQNLEYLVAHFCKSENILILKHQTSIFI